MSSRCRDPRQVALSLVMASRGNPERVPPDEVSIQHRGTSVNPLENSNQGSFHPRVRHPRLAQHPISALNQPFVVIPGHFPLEVENVISQITNFDQFRPYRLAHPSRSEEHTSE